MRDTSREPYEGDVPPHAPAGSDASGPIREASLIAGFGYAFDSFVTVLSDGSPFAISTVTFLGEFLLGLWLLIRGSRLSLGTDGHAV